MKIEKEDLFWAQKMRDALGADQWEADDARKMAEEAVKIALDAHRGQVRDHGRPYFTHLISTVTILRETCDVEDPEILITALLHDSLEDGYPKSKDAILDRLGRGIYQNICGLSKEYKFSSAPCLDHEAVERRHAYFAKIGTLAEPLIAVKLVDRIHNITELPKNSNPEKWQRYCRETGTWFLPLADRLAGVSGQWQRLPSILREALKDCDFETEN